MAEQREGGRWFSSVKAKTVRFLDPSGLKVYESIMGLNSFAQIYFLFSISSVVQPALYWEKRGLVKSGSGIKQICVCV